MSRIAAANRIPLEGGGGRTTRKAPPKSTKTQARFKSPGSSTTKKAPQKSSFGRTSPSTKKLTGQVSTPKGPSLQRTPGAKAKGPSAPAPHTNTRTRVPSAPPKDLPLPGDTTTSPHVGDKNLSVGHDGKVTGRLKLEKKKDLLNPQQPGAEAAPKPEVPDAGKKFSGKIEAGPFNNTEVTFTREPTDEKGNTRTHFTFQNETGAGLKAEGQKGGTGGEFSAAEGFRGNMTFSVDMKPDALARITNGDVDIPNPLEPETLPVGSKLTLRGEHFNKSDAKGAFRGLNLFGGFEQANGRALTMERLDDNHVRVTGGPFDRTNNSIGFGFGGKIKGVEVGAELKMDRTFLNTGAKSVQFDISTVEGKQAFQKFVNTGEFPRSGEGVSDFHSIRALKDSREFGANLNAGFAQFNATFGKGESKLIEQVSPAGTRYDYSANWKGNPVELSWLNKAGGGQELLKLEMPVSAKDANYIASNRKLGEAFEAAGKRWDPQAQVGLSFDEKGVMQMRDLQAAALRSRARGNRTFSQELRDMAADPNVTHAQFADAAGEILRNTKPYSSPRGLPRLFNPMQEGLLKAQNPVSAAMTLAVEQALGNPNNGIPHGFTTGVAQLGRDREAFLNSPHIALDIK